MARPPTYCARTNEVCVLLLLLLPFQFVQAVGDEPVWRQVLRKHLDHGNPAVVQQAAAALAE
jgi:hypothetical protein